MNWDGARRQRGAGSISGSTGSLQRFDRPAGRITPTGCRKAIAGGTLDYGLSAVWPDDIRPVVRAHFRWKRGPWIPVAAAESAAEECYDDSHEPGADDQRSGDDEWVWSPRATEHWCNDVTGLSWRIVESDGGFEFEVQVGPTKRSASMPIDVVRMVDGDEAHSDLVAYATAIMAQHGTQFALSRVGEALRRNDGEPCGSRSNPKAVASARSTKVMAASATKRERAVT